MLGFNALYDDTEENRELFRTTIRRNRGNLAATRRELGLAHKTIYRYLVRFRLWETIDAARGVDAAGVDYDALYDSAVPRRDEGKQHLRVAMERRRSIE